MSAGHVGTRGLFVTGTDTGVGKTVVAASLAAAWRRSGLDVGVMKPVLTGTEPLPGGLIAPDAELLKRAAEVDDPLERICPFQFQEPVAPSVAAAVEGRSLDPVRIVAAYRELARVHPWMIVEGAGGIGVPLTGRYLMSDLARDLDLPVLVVARPALGTINHSLLTVRFAQAAGLRVLGVVLSNFPAEPGLAERSAASVIEELAGVPILGILPAAEGVDTERGELGDLQERIAASGLPERVRHLLEGASHEPCGK